MKKVILSLLALSLMVPVIGQNQIEMERVAKEAKEKSTKLIQSQVACFEN